MRPSAILVLLALSPFAFAAEPRARVTLELLTQTGVPITASQSWHQALSGLGVAGVQIHSAGNRDQPRIEQLGDAKSGRYRAVGVVTADGMLHLPGGKFSTGDKTKLGKWLDDLADLGPEGVSQPAGAFGLIKRQLEEVMADLGRTVDFSTKDQPAAAAVNRIAGTLRIPLEIDPAAASALGEVTVQDELQKISAGTALAAIARPAGVVLVPERATQGRLRYRLLLSKAVPQSWPVGWPPEKRPNQLVPEMLTSLSVEIHDTSVAETVSVIKDRLKIPFLWDYNAMALHGIDTTAAMADVPDKKMTYMQILNRVLLQAKLKYELRVDEAGKPLLWITSVKPAN